MAVVLSVVGVGVGVGVCVGSVVVASLGLGELVGDGAGSLLAGLLSVDGAGSLLVAVVGELVGDGALLSPVVVPAGEGVAVGVVPGCTGGASWRIATISALNVSSWVVISVRV